MLYKYSKRTRDFFVVVVFFWGGGVNFIFVFYILGVFLIKINIPFALVKYEMIIANSELCNSLAAYHL